MTGIAEIDIDQDEDACSGDDDDDETDSVIGMYRHLQDQGQNQIQLLGFCFNLTTICFQNQRIQKQVILSKTND